MGEETAGETLCSTSMNETTYVVFHSPLDPGSETTNPSKIKSSSNWRRNSLSTELLAGKRQMNSMPRSWKTILTFRREANSTLESIKRF
jgi:hypothetical protein